MKIIESSAQSTEYLVERDRRTEDLSGPLLTLLPQQRMQTFLGFGGAFTEASAYALSFLDPQARRSVLEDYFDGDRGNGYRLGRVTIHSCDFSCESYTYMNDRFDRDLASFSVERDEALVLPMIRDAQEVAGEDQINFFASPWSPPSFMKTNNIMTFGGSLRPEYAQMWADYMVQFLAEYQRRGIHCFGVTTQNEPEATQTWESCLYTAEQERDFIRDHLGPALKASGLGTQVIAHDHNRDHVYERSVVAFSDPQCSQYVWGAGIHWYMTEDFANTQRLHDEFPDKGIIFTEGCCAWDGPEGSWDGAEFYAHNIINDLNTWVQAWTDWNLVLDEHGGPNHVENYCAAPIIVDTQRRKVIHQPSYYAIGHFSRYITPGAVRIGHSIEGETGLEFTTWDSHGRIVVTALNQSDAEQVYTVDAEGQRYGIGIPAHAIQTVVS